MFSKIGKVIFGSSNDRQLNKLRPTINKINDLEKEISKLDKNKLIEKTKLFKNRSASYCKYLEKVLKLITIFGVIVIYLATI